MKPWDIVSKILRTLALEAKAGVTTNMLNDIGEQMIKEMGAVSVSKGALVTPAKEPYPKSIVISVNSEIAHGIASDYVLKEGDIVNIDLGVKKDGICGDAALTVGVGTISENDKRLLKVARLCLDAAVDSIRDGADLVDVGLASYRMAKQYDFVVSKRFCGHAIGKDMHMEPLIFHSYDTNYKPNIVLKEGMMICLEPIITKKDNYGFLDQNLWTARTRDGRNSAMFEHQVLVTKTGCKILTTHLD